MDKIALYVNAGTKKGIKEQIDYCRNRIHLDYGKEISEKALLFKDIAPETFDEQKALQLLLDAVRSKKITKLYVDDINVFARDMNDIAKVCNELIDNNCEVIFGYSKEALTKEYINYKLSITDYIKKIFCESIRNSKYIPSMLRKERIIEQIDMRHGKRERKRIGRIKEILNVKVNDYGNNDLEHDNVFWYGGEVASIKTSNGEYKIVARGQVRCNLIAKEDYIDEDGKEIKKGDIVASIIDKNQDGLFKSEMIPFIKNDTELNIILQYKHKKYELNIGNNNWFDLEFYNSNGDLEYDDYVLDSHTLTDAVQETKKIIWEENKDLKKYAIYCRLSSFKDNAESYFKNSEDYCLDILNSKVTKDADIVKVYIETAPSKENSAAAFGVLLRDIKDNKIKDVFTLSLDRLTRDKETFLNVYTTLKESGSDIFLIKENAYFVKDLAKEQSILIMQGLGDEEQKENDMEEEYEY